MCFDFYYEHRPVELYWQTTSDRHALVIMTALRPLGATLDGTLRSLKDAGVDRWLGPKVIASDGLYSTAHSEHSEVISNWKVLEHHPSRGSAYTFIRTIEYLLRTFTNLDYLTIIEDDVELCKYALDYMSQVKIPEDISFLSWFTYPYDFSGSDRRPNYEANQASEFLPETSLVCRSSRFFVLNQACTYPRRTLERLLACHHIVNDWPRRNGHDEMPAWALGDALYATHLPILVQHTGGLNSAVKLSREEIVSSSSDPQKGSRMSPLYVGASFDASKLLL